MRSCAPPLTHVPFAQACKAGVPLMRCGRAGRPRDDGAHDERAAAPAGAPPARPGAPAAGAGAHPGPARPCPYRHALLPPPLSCVVQILLVPGKPGNFILTCLGLCTCVLLHRVCLRCALLCRAYPLQPLGAGEVLVAEGWFLLQARCWSRCHMRMRSSRRRCECTPSCPASSGAPCRWVYPAGICAGAGIGKALQVPTSTCQ